MGAAWEPLHSTTNTKDNGPLDHPTRASPLPWTPPWKASPQLNVHHSNLALSVTCPSCLRPRQEFT
eukprot:7992414-Pyramimonas_sp.AAC.1